MSPTSFAFAIAAFGTAPAAYFFVRSRDWRRRYLDSDAKLNALLDRPRLDLKADKHAFLTRLEQEVRKLDRIHPGWLELVKTQAFARWAEDARGTDLQVLMRNSSQIVDADEVSALLFKFKAQR